MSSDDQFIPQTLHLPTVLISLTPLFYIPLFFSMELAWNIPDDGVVNINVHLVRAEQPSKNENANGLELLLEMRKATNIGEFWV